MDLGPSLDSILETLKLLFRDLGHSIDGLVSTGVYEWLEIGNGTAI